MSFMIFGLWSYYYSGNGRTIGPRWGCAVKFDLGRGKTGKGTLGERCLEELAE